MRMGDCKHRGPVAVLYGSQTGTAQDVGERIWRGLKRRLFTCSLHAMDSFPIRNLVEERFVVFVCSTTGQGDEPDNMRRFWKFLLRKDLPPTSLQLMKFGVLGLGDSSYQRFNFVAKRLHKRLLQLGGTSVVSLGLADDEHDLGADAIVDPWIEELFLTLDTFYPLPEGAEVIKDDVLLPPKYIVTYLSPDEVEKYKDCSTVSRFTHTSSEHLEPCALAPFDSVLLDNQRVTPQEHFQDVRLIRLDINGSGITYSPGDVIMIQPQNSSKSVEDFLSLLSLEGERSISLHCTDPSIPPPPPSLVNPCCCTLRECAQNLWDINSVPRRYFFELLAHFADDELEREKLLEFSSASGQEELFAYCNRPRRKILEVLHDFPHAASKIQVDYLFDLLPTVQPRAFSIASSLRAHPGEVQVLLAVVKYKTKLFEPRRGLCSTWLAGLARGDRVPVWRRSGTLTFPTNSNTPIIMVAPGTGCAPFRACIEERLDTGILTQHNTTLVFGCRNKLNDFYFEDEWSKLSSEGKLTLLTAFSRDQPHKVYVQHKLREASKLVHDVVVRRGGLLYIAGNSKQMPDSVKEAICFSLVAEGGMSEEEAETFVGQLEKHRRLQMETWS